MEGVGYETELWVWQLVPLAPGDPEPDPADKRIPKGFKIDALYWGVGLPLLLPR